jgi:hypothetical protein
LLRSNWIKKRSKKNQKEKIGKKLARPGEGMLAQASGKKRRLAQANGDLAWARGLKIGSPRRR